MAAFVFGKVCFWSAGYKDIEWTPMTVKFCLFLVTKRGYFWDPNKDLYCLKAAIKMTNFLRIQH
jgi:hypothetical protein